MALTPSGMTPRWAPASPDSPAFWLRGLFALSLLLVVPGHWAGPALTPDGMLLASLIYLGLHGLLAWRGRNRPEHRYSLLPLLTDSLAGFIPALGASEPALAGGLSLLLLLLANGPAYGRNRTLAALLPAWLAWLAVAVVRADVAADAAIPTLTVLLTAGAWLLLFRYWELAAAMEQLPGIDPLTGLANRATLHDAARYFIPYQQRNRTSLVVMLCEIELEETAGRKIVRRSLMKRALQQFGQIVENRLRGCDIAVYYGDNRFAFLLTDTHHKGAEQAAADLGKPFEDWARDCAIHARLRTGIAPLPMESLALDHVISRLHQAIETTRIHAPQRLQPVFIDPAQLRESTK